MTGNDITQAAWRRVAKLIPDNEARPIVESHAREWIHAVEWLARLETPSPAVERAEHDLWRSLVEVLQGAGAVTKEDGRRPLSDQSTPGTKLYRALKAWGDTRAAVVRAELDQQAA